MEINRIIEASEFTKEVNKKSIDGLNFEDDVDFKCVERGFVTQLNLPEKIEKEDGSIAYNMEDWAFLRDNGVEAPQTVNSSLWRQSRLNSFPYGLFEVLDGAIYQVRGYDIANMSFVKGSKGWVVIDVLGTKETASAGLKLFREYIEKIKKEKLTIAAVIITHPHADHYGGIEAFAEYKIPIIGPSDFMSHAVNENLLAGRAMRRRARYMYGMLIEKNAQESVGSGLGQTNSTGEQDLHPVCIEIDKDQEWEENEIGLCIEFIHVMETEAPSEIMTYFPKYKAFCVAEELNHTMHNLITLRGAKVRNGLIWSKAIDKVIEKYGKSVEISFSTHHWPTWGNDSIVQFWEDQRDIYRYLHDRTLNLMNRGYTPVEIAEVVKLPGNLANKFYNREYYGTVSHNVKSQYQLYLGWFDGNPANLNPLTPEMAGKKYIEAMGGADKAIEMALKSYNTGDYRWAATLLNHLVFADSGNVNARVLLANVYSQLGYQSESGPWRNFYLTAAKELIDKPDEISLDLTMKEIENLNPEQLFDFMAINLIPEKAEKMDMEVSIYFTDAKNHCTLILKNGTLTNRIKSESDNIADISMDFVEFKEMLVKYKEPEVPGQLNSLFEILDFNTNASFNIIEP